MRRWLLLWLLCLLPLAAVAEVEVPALKARVTDLTGTLTAEQSAALESRLAAFEAKKGSQVAVLIVPTTEPETIEQYGIRVAEQWKLGRKGVDDGALLLVARNDRTLRIEVGYGLEGALNDATSKRIIEEIIIPRFKAGDFYGGISAGVDAMLGVIQGEPLPEPKHGRHAGSAGVLDQYFPVLFVVAIVAGAILRSVLGNFMGGVATGGLVGFVVWMLGAGLALVLILAFAAFVMTLAGGGRGFYTGGGWGGGGGFGGGGFSGGGGGFGGGGASGRW